jgi:hypothetical protein
VERSVQPALWNCRCAWSTFCHGDASARDLGGCQRRDAELNLRRPPSSSQTTMAVWIAAGHVGLIDVASLERPTMEASSASDHRCQRSLPLPPLSVIVADVALSRRCCWPCSGDGSGSAQRTAARGVRVACAALRGVKPMACPVKLSIRPLSVNCKADTHSFWSFCSCAPTAVRFFHLVIPRARSDLSCTTSRVPVFCRLHRR